MTIQKILLAVLLFAGLAGVSQAGDFSNSVTGVAGYDLVSYQTGKRPVRGNGHYVSVEKGISYLFSSKENKELFDADPAKYLPAYGGFCAYGVSVGKKFIGDPEVWRVVDGVLYLNLDANIQDEWLKDVPGRIEAADEKWAKISKSDPASL